MKLETAAMAATVRPFAAPAVQPVVPAEPTEKAAQGRNDAAAVLEKNGEEEKKKTQLNSELFLNKIKELTDNGSYSVRFEMNPSSEQLVIRLVDSDTGDLIRQIPSEELMGLAEQLKNLRGSLLDTES